TQERPQPLAAARRALGRLHSAADTPLLRAYHHCARASYQFEIGDAKGCLRRLAHDGSLRQRLDVPWLQCEAAVVAARALRATGAVAEARRQAKMAWLLAVEYGW